MNTVVKENYFAFEADFTEGNVRCIPMIVRFKLDACGIKLKLKEWSKMTVEERENLAALPCQSAAATNSYREYLKQIIWYHTGEVATVIPVMDNPSWSIVDEIPFPVQEKLNEFGCVISVQQWKALSDLQRFALLKLSYPGHENRNFPKAIKEFNLWGDREIFENPQAC
jgi:hypothetical protein